VNRKIGDRIKDYRLMLRLSQDNVAEEIGMSAGNYGKIERGEIDISSSHLVKLAKILKVHVGDFFDDRATATKEKSHSYGYATREELHQLSDTVLQLVREVERLRESLTEKKSKSQSKKSGNRH
jgi:transcriptional regulator with XRE-family HTH domain